MWPSTTAECASPSQRRVSELILAGYRRRRSAARVRSPATWKPVASAAVCKSRRFRSLFRSLGVVWACKHWAKRMCVTVSKTAASGSTPGSPVAGRARRTGRALLAGLVLGWRSASDYPTSRSARVGCRSGCRSRAHRAGRERASGARSVAATLALSALKAKALAPSAA
jgi:hypothetical protein